VGEGEGKKGEAYDLKNPNQGEKPQHLALTSRSLQNFRLVSTVSQPQKWCTTYILIKYNGTRRQRGLKEKE